MNRDRYVDFLRAWAILLVVAGHWLITGLVRLPDGTIRAPELLVAVPWTQWLTLGFQIMPLFFLAGGYAAGGSWERARAAGGTAAGWVGQRAIRLLLPTAVYSGLVLAALGICLAVGVDPGTIALVGWAMAMQFWFLPVYLLLSALTPVLYALHRRGGLVVPVVGGVGALGVSWLVAATSGGGAGVVGAVNYLLVWGVVYQLGFCWRDRLVGRGPVVPAGMLAGGGVAFALLVGVGPFPVSLILVSGEELSNTTPPSAAMLAWAVAQVGLALLVAPLVRRVVGRAGVGRAVRGLGAVSMTLYLWHMLPVLVVAAAFYLTGLAPQPPYGSTGWWLLRVPWLVLLGLVLGLLVRALRPLERRLALTAARVRPGAGVRGPGAWRVWAGVVVSAWALAYFAGHGFAYEGRFPRAAAVGLAVGVALVADPGVCRQERGDEKSGGRAARVGAV